MVLIGIDYSMNSVGITIKCPDGIRFFSVVNSYSLSKAADFDLVKNGGVSRDVLLSLDGYKIVTRIPYSKDKNKDKLFELNNWHDCLLSGSDDLSNEVMNIIKPFLTNCRFVVFENYITRNGGDSTVQIIEFTRDLKTKLIIFGFKDIKIISAPEIKMYAGKGNFTKEDMLNAFLTHHSGSKFHAFVVKNKNKLIKNKNNIVKPVDDVVDSYFAIEAFLSKSQAIDM